MSDEFDDNDIGDMDDIESMLAESDDIGGMSQENDGDGPTDSVVDDVKTALDDSLDAKKIANVFSKSMTNVMPGHIGKRVNDGADFVSDTMDTLDKQLTSVKKSAASTVGSIADVLPESMQSPFLALKGWLTEDSTDTSNNEPTEDEKIKDEVNSLLGSMTKDSITSNKSDEVNILLEKKDTELLANIAYNTDSLLGLKASLDNTYYKKDLELQIKQTFTLVKIHDLLQRDSEIRTKQLEALVHNTALPDFAKTKSSEFIKQAMIHNAIGASSSMFKNMGIFKKASTNINRLLDDKISAFTSSMDTMNGALETVNGLDGVMSKSALAMSLGLDAGISKVSGSASKKIMSKILANEGGVDALNGANKYTSDVHMGFKDLAKKAEKDGSTKKQKIYEGLSSVFENPISTNSNTISEVGKLNDATIMDNKLKKTIEVVIPGLLTKMLSELTSIRKGNSEIDEKDIVTYNFNKNRFNNKTEVLKDTKTKLEDIGKTTAANVSDKNILKVLLGKNPKPEYKAETSKALLSYILAGKSVSPYYMLEDGFINEFPPGKVRRLVKSNLEKFIKPTNDKELQEITDFQDKLESIRDNMSSYSEVIKEVQAASNEDVLADLGMVDKDNRSTMTSSNMSNIHKEYTDKILDKQAEDEVAKKGSFFKGGYTGDGRTDVVAGVVHKEEFVLDKKTLTDLIKDVSKGDFDSIKSTVENISKEVSEESKKFNLKETKDEIETTLNNKFNSFTNTVTDLIKPEDDTKEALTTLKDKGLTKTKEAFKSGKELMSEVNTSASTLGKELYTKYDVGEKVSTLKNNVNELDNKYGISEKANELNEKYDITGKLNTGKAIIDESTELLNTSLLTLANSVNNSIKDLDYDTFKTKLDSSLDNVSDTLKNSFETASLSLTSFTTGMFSSMGEKIEEFKKNDNGILDTLTNEMSSLSKTLGLDTTNLAKTTKEEIESLFNVFKSTTKEQLTDTEDDTEDNKTKSIMDNITSVVTTMSSKAKNAYKDVKAAVTGIPNVDDKLLDNVKKMEQVMNDKGIQSLLKQGLKEMPLPKTYQTAKSTYKDLLISIDPSGTIWKQISKDNNFIEDMQKLHMEAIEESQKSLVDKALDAATNGLDKSTSFIGSMRDKAINALPKPLQGLAKKALDNRITKYGGKQLSRVGKAFKTAGKVTLDELKVIGKEGKDLFIDKDGKLHAPNALDLAKFTGKSYFKSMKAVSKGVKELYPEIFGAAKDTVGAATGMAWDTLGVKKTLNRTKNKIKAKIKPPIPRKLYKSWTSGEMTAKEVMDVLNEKDKETWAVWLQENTRPGITLPEILGATGKWYAKAMGQTSKGVKSTYTTAGKGIFGASKVLGKAAYAFSGLDTIFGSSKNNKENTESDVETEISKVEEPIETVKTKKHKAKNKLNKRKQKKQDKKESLEKEELKVEPDDMSSKTDETIFKDISKNTNELITSFSIKISELTDILKKKEETTINKETKPKTKKEKYEEIISPFDKDGDGDRDGNAKDRLAKLYGKKKKVNNVKADIKQVVEKDNSKGIIAGLMMTVIPFLLGGFKKTFSTALNVLKHPLDSISSLLGKGIGLIAGGLKSLGSTILNKVGSVTSHIGNVIKNSKVGKVVGNVLSKGKTVIAKAVKKILPSTVKAFLGRLKILIIKKIGVKAGASLLSKIASRFVPFLGWSLLAYDAVKVGYYMLHDKLSFKSAVSKQILGFDIFDKNEAAVDADGNPIKPDIPEDKVEKEVKKTIKQPLTKEEILKPSNNITYKDNKVSKTLKDTFNKESLNKPIHTELVKPLDIKNIKVPLKPIMNTLKRDEGNVLHKYKDSLGYETIGVGHLLDKRKGGKTLREVLGIDKDTITPSESDYILVKDINATSKELYKKLPWLEQQPKNIQTDLLNMAFNLGVTGLMKFNNTLKRIKNFDYKIAVSNLRKSLWRKQVGIRADNIINDINNTPANNIIKPINNIDIKSKADVVKQAVLKAENDKKILGKIINVKPTDHLDNLKHIDTKTNKPVNTKSKIVISKEDSKTINTLKESHAVHVDTNSILDKSLKVQYGMYNKLDELVELNKNILNTLSDGKADVTKHHKANNRPIIEHSIKPVIPHTVNGF